MVRSVPSNRCESMASAIVDLAKFCHQMTPLAINQNGLFTREGETHFVTVGNGKKLLDNKEPLYISFRVPGNLADQADDIASQWHLALREKMDGMDAPNYFVVQAQGEQIYIYIGPIRDNPERMARAFQPNSLTAGLRKFVDGLRFRSGAEDTKIENLDNFEKRIRHQLGAASMASPDIQGQIVPG
jgi:hypothetical protein